MNQLLLAPTDLLFFRDGRPMGGSLSGNGAAWPLPTVTNAALHAALWRSGLANQSHAHGRNGPDAVNRAERFGSLTTAGPFPVCTQGAAPTWFFPAPADARCNPVLDVSGKQTGLGKIENTFTPVAPLSGSKSSNPLPLNVASLIPPSKDTTSPWWSEGAWASYLGTSSRGTSETDRQTHSRVFTKNDADFSSREATIGIGISPETGAQDGEHIYSAHYLRLHEGWNLGLFAETAEKFTESEMHGSRRDLIPELINQSHQLLTGGQQRLCTASLRILPANERLPLPLGRTSNFTTATLNCLVGTQPRHLVKWVLLTPAIFPALDTISPTHPGGWLPSWIHPTEHTVQLRAPLPPRNVASESRNAYRTRVQIQPTITACLVAAMVGKPLPVTGWSLGTTENPEALPRNSGAKSTHFAVPAGSVYYFACDSAAAAGQLAAALNWHGDTAGTTIRNRRSTLLGEKGFGLGVCGTWTPRA